MLLLACTFVSFARAQAPDPQLVSEDWKLQFTHTEPRVIAIPDGEGGHDWYWYIAYKVVNPGKEDVLFFPGFTVATDKGDIVPANTDISPLAFPMIKKQLRNELVESSAEVVGMIKQGVDYAKEGVIIWKDFGHDVDQFKVFIAGTSGETQSIEHPVTGEPVFLRRTIELVYDTPGNPPSPQDQAKVTVLVTEQEVMR